MSDEIKDLRWVRIFTPIHIPKYLIEQIKDRDWKPDEFIKYHEINCLNDGKEGPELNPFSHLYVLVNPDNITKGFLWFTVEALTKDIHIQNYSVDRAYWGKGRAVEKLADHIKFIKKKANLNKVYWITKYPKHSQHYGFKPSSSVLMEYSEDNNGKHIHGESEGKKHRTPNTRAEEVSGKCIERDGAASEPSIPAVPAAV